MAILLVTSCTRVQTNSHQAKLLQTRFQTQNFPFTPEQCQQALTLISTEPKSNFLGDNASKNNRQVLFLMSSILFVQPLR